MVKYYITVTKDYSTLNTQSQTRYLNNFRGEPAITNLDWPFTPNYRSSQTNATVTSSVLKKTFNLPIIRSISFGSNIYNFTSNYLCLQKVKLAIYINSLAHYAKGTL